MTLRITTANGRAYDLDQTELITIKDKDGGSPMLKTVKMTRYYMSLGDDFDLVADGVQSEIVSIVPATT